MTKNTKMLIGIGAVAVAGYLIWKNQSATSSFAGPVGRRTKYNATGKNPCPLGCTYNAATRSCMCSSGPFLPNN